MHANLKREKLAKAIDHTYIITNVAFLISIQIIYEKYNLKKFR